MVTQITSLSRSGLSDFVIQRATAVVLALYSLCVLSFFLANPGLDHQSLMAFFGHAFMQAFSVLAVLSTVAHGWIGMWTVGTDYIRPHYFGRYATICRIIYLVGAGLILFVYAWWGIRLFWML